MGSTTAILPQVITRECANHMSESNRVRNVCLPKDAPCPMLAAVRGQLPRCAYLEECVLPAYPEVEAVYFAEREAAELGIPFSAAKRQAAMRAARKPKPCARCGAEFVPTTNRQRFCPGCGDDARKAGNAERKRRQRAAS